MNEKKRKRKNVISSLVEAGLDPATAETFLPKLNDALGKHGLAILSHPIPDLRPWTPPTMPRSMM